MEYAKKNAYKIKLKNFEGPFDLLFHLIEKNEINIYDIPINDITDQYMDYLFQMEELDLEIASEFLVMAATLLHIKSRMLLPAKKEEKEEEIDPREELVYKLIQYKKFKELSEFLKVKEKQWRGVYYKFPETHEYGFDIYSTEISFEKLKNCYINLLIINNEKINRNVGNIHEIIRHEKVSLKNKMKEILNLLLKKSFFIFSNVFSVEVLSRIEIITGFLAVLELSKAKKLTIKQKKLFDELYIYERTSKKHNEQEDMETDIRADASE
jgi:segregation and condensation protein A